MISTFFAHWDRRPNSRDRRRACRYAPVRNLVFLGWWKGEEFQTITAFLKDVSLGGASIVFSSPPPDDAVVWVSLYQVPPTDWVEATIIEAHKIPGPRLFSRRSTQIRIKFFEDCSYELFKSSIEVEKEPRSQ